MSPIALNDDLALKAAILRPGTKVPAVGDADQLARVQAADAHAASEAARIADEKRRAALNDWAAGKHLDALRAAATPPPPAADPVTLARGRRDGLRAVIDAALRGDTSHQPKDPRP